MTLFFNPMQLKKLEIVRHLIFHDYMVKTHELANQLDVSSKTIIRYSQSLTEDCQRATDSPLFHVTHTSGVITLTFSKEVTPSYIIDSLTVLYANESIRVTIIDTLLEKRYSNVLNLADALFLTPAGLYNHLYQLESVLKPFGLSFHWLKETDGLNFIYNEKKMRYFSYLFYWNMFKGFQPLQFEAKLNNVAELKTAIATQFPESSFTVNTLQLTYLAQITLWHMQHPNSVHLSDANADLLRLISAVKDYSVVLQPALTPTEDERLFFNLLTRVSISSLDSDDNKLEIMTSVMTHKSSMALYCQHLHDALVTQFKYQPSKKASIHFYYDLLIFTVFNQEINVSFENEFMIDFDISFYQKESQLQPNALKTMTDIFKQVSEYYQFPIQNIEMAQSIMWLFLASPHPKKMVTIAICIARTPMGISIIQNRLLQLFNTEIIKFTEQPSEADLVISDYTYSIKGKQEFFYMDQLNDPHCWNLLFESIQNRLSKHVL